MATRPPIGLPKLSRRSRILLIIAAIFLGLLLVGSRLLSTYVNWLWFGEVGFRSVFTTVIWTRISLFFSVGALVGGLLALSLWIAYRSRPVFVPVSSADDPLARYRSTIVQRVRLFGIGIPLLIGLISGSAAQNDWQLVQLMFNATEFGVTDPQFNIDLGFYAFQLPFIGWVISWLFVSVAIAFFGALITHYIFGGIRLAGKGGQLAAPARMQLSIIAGLFVLIYAVDYFFERYELLFSTRNTLFSGATYTDLNAVLPAKLILMFIAGFCAVAFFAGAFLRNLQLPAIATALLILSGLLVGVGWPAIIQQFSVRPNENAKEALSIQRNIDATRAAYGVSPEKVTIQDYPGRTDASGAAIRADQSSTNTLSNVRLLDPNILAPTFTQREGRENFYGFPEKLDIDRYTIDGKTQDYIVAAREIKTTGLTETQGGWINRHMVFTHGNGFVAAPANTVNSALQDSSDQGGFPIFKVSDLATQGPIKVDQPRVYYGELATDYAIVGGKNGDKPMEYDTSSSTVSYQGTGGVPIDNLFNKLLFTLHHAERNILFSSQIGEGAKIMYNRNPRDRVSQVAPWLTLDGDPYPAVVNGKILWIVDGYTTLENYPYAQRTSLGDVTTDSLGGVVRQENRTISYIRNSVKATVDAYDGSVSLYSIDDQDPVLKAWQKVFPGTVKAKSEIPAGLSDHFRYPEDLFKVQRELLSKYHVADAGEFFSQKTFWNVPADPTEDGGSNTTGNGANQPPYYVLAQAPGQTKATFQITSALTLLNRAFLASWVSVSSDPQDYGKIRILRLPTSGSVQIDGPGQVQNRFLTTPEVAENRTLIQNPTVNVRFGNLLTLPVADGLLFVEPIYIQRKDANAFPQLARVLVSFGNKVGFAPTIDEALNEVFGAGTGDTATKPGENGTNPSTSTSAPTTTAPPPSGGTSATPEMDQAVQALNAAIAHLREAQRSGDFTEQGKALAELDAAAKKYDEAKAKAGQPSSNPSTPGASPSPTPPPTGGG